jgi:two-component system C4-dicarboxylate transport sensor histidine kinase DctB
MASGYMIRRSFRRWRTGLALALLVFGGALIYVSAAWWKAQAERQLQDKAAETLAVQTEALNGILDKYRLLPPLLSREHSVVELFNGAGDVQRANEMAAIIMGMSGAKDVAFLRADRSVLAASQGLFAVDTPQHGHLLDAADQGRLGRQAVTLGAQRAYAFAFGVREEGKLVGYTIVYVDFDPVEATWSLSPNPIFVVDRGGTVFLSNRPQWRLKKLGDLMSGDRTGRHFADVGSAIPYGDISRELPLLDWQLHVLSDERPIATARMTGGLIAALTVLVFGVALAALLQRREAQTWQRRRDRSVALWLERKVLERTRALRQINLSLSQEIEVRRQAEERLRKAQAELVQSAKLAALGQMSAALSHEFNQPLTAIRTYADSAGRLLEKGRADSVKDNLSRISGLVDRMAGLSRSLLSFSRKPGTTVGPIALVPVFEEAFMLTKPRARKAGVILTLDVAESLPDALGGRIRLSQVFVNLINNAVDAAGGHADGRVILSAETDGGWIEVRVEDNGPGIRGDMRDQVFEPFFTTKEAGSGIGIGLSIAASIVRDFGGTISVAESALGGACFTVRLAAAANTRQAAE